jgi:NAD(P)-dependent dehydrogenase (short-subunit alcohol dehydrogenase family)/catechol 2,3-dioxygenase-like lactoylglutathione lyase family enzyme
MVAFKSFNTTAGTAAAVAVAASLLVYVASQKKRVANQAKHHLPPATKTTTRQEGRVSHVRIQTWQLEQSVAFYQAMGLVVCKFDPNNDNTEENQFVILKCPGEKLHQPFIILEKVSESITKENDLVRTGTASDVGIARFCLAVAHVPTEIKRLEQQGYLPIASPVTDKPGSPDENGVAKKETPCTIVAFRDPSGILVELASQKPTMANRLLFPLLGIQYPLFVHINVNASNYEQSLNAYKDLGFTTIFKHYGKVVNNLYKALNIADPGVAKQVCLIKTPKESFFSIDLIEWESSTTSTAAAAGEALLHLNSPVRLALTVHDLPAYMDKLLETKKWSMVQPPRLESFSRAMGNSISATMNDPDGVNVELVAYADTDKEFINFDARNRVVLVTGCDSGFGRGLACRIAALGFHVVAACYTQAGSRFLQGVATTVKADLSTKEGIQAVCQTCEAVLLEGDEKRDLWAIINNAGYCQPGNVEWNDPSVYEHTMNVNFHAPIAINHHFINHLKEAKGRIIQLSSVCGMVSIATNSSYCSTKHAIESYCDCLRAEMRPWGVKVCIIQPATMRTPLAMSYWSSWLQGYEKASPDRQSSFDKEAIQKLAETQQETLEAMAEDPDITVSAILKALVVANPPTRLGTGKYHGIFTLLSYFPDQRCDAFFYSELEKVHVKVL